MLVYSVAASSRAATVAIASGPEPRQFARSNSSGQQPGRSTHGVLARVQSGELEATPSHVGFHPSYTSERQPLTMSRQDAEDNRTVRRTTSGRELSFAASRHAEDVPTFRRSISGELAHGISRDNARGSSASPSAGCACAGCEGRGRCGSVAAAPPRRRRRSTKCDVKKLASGLRIACTMSAGLVSEFLTGQTLWNALQSQDALQHLVFVAAFIFATGAAISSESVDEVDACDMDYAVTNKMHDSTTASNNNKQEPARAMPALPAHSAPEVNRPHEASVATEDAPSGPYAATQEVGDMPPQLPVARAWASRGTPEQSTGKAMPLAAGAATEPSDALDEVEGSLPLNTQGQGRATAVPSLHRNTLAQARRMGEVALGVCADMVWPAVTSISKGLGEENLNGKLAIAGVFLVLLFQAIAENIPTLG